jgi:hypothetical protein
LRNKILKVVRLSSSAPIAYCIHQMRDALALLLPPAEVASGCEKPWMSPSALLPHVLSLMSHFLLLHPSMPRGTRSLSRVCSERVGGESCWNRRLHVSMEERAQAWKQPRFSLPRGMRWWGELLEP